MNKIRGLILVSILILVDTQGYCFKSAQSMMIVGSASERQTSLKYAEYALDNAPMLTPIDRCAVQNGRPIYDKATDTPVIYSSRLDKYIVVRIVSGKLVRSEFSFSGSATALGVYGDTLFLSGDGNTAGYNLANRELQQYTVDFDSIHFIQPSLGIAKLIDVKNFKTYVYRCDAALKIDATNALSFRNVILISEFNPQGLVLIVESPDVLVHKFKADDYKLYLLDSGTMKVRTLLQHLYLKRNTFGWMSSSVIYYAEPEGDDCIKCIKTVDIQTGKASITIDFKKGSVLRCYPIFNKNYMYVVEAHNGKQELYYVDNDKNTKTKLTDAVSIGFCGETTDGKVMVVADGFVNLYVKEYP